MKKPLPLYFILFISVPGLHSCTNTQYATQRKEALSGSRILTAPSECFVQLTDGTIQNYSSLRLVTSMYKSPHLLADGKIKILPEEIMAYQNNKHYAISSAGFSYGGHKGNLAVETLPGFAVRIASGHLNVYVKKYKENNMVFDEYYLQEGKGQILLYSPELMDALIKNSPEALVFFNNNRKHIKLTQELKATAKIYNDSYFNKPDDDKQGLARTDKKKLKFK